MQNSQKKQDRIIKAFTGWRGLAVLFVSLYHWFPKSIDGGYLGVVIFLTLSGYLVTDSFFSEFKATGTIKIGKFYLKRIRRLYPPLIFMILLVTTWCLFLQNDLLYSYRGSVFTTLFGVNNWWQIGQNLSYFQQFSLPGIFTHMWALAVEMQIYLLWPLVILLLVKIRPKYLRRNTTLVAMVSAVISILILAVTYLTSENISRAYYGTDSRIFSFFMGVVLACGFNRDRLKKISGMLRPKAKMISYGIFAVLILFLFILPGDKWITYMGGMFIFNALLLISLLTTASEKSIGGKFMMNPIFIYLGERSYSLYLWQYTIWALSKSAFRTVNIPYNVTVLLQIIFLLILAEITYQLMERNFTTVFNSFKLHKIYFNNEFHWQSLPVILLSLLLSVSFVVAMVKSPAGLPADIVEMQERLANSKKIAENQANQKGNADKDQNNENNGSNAKENNEQNKANQSEKAGENAVNGDGEKQEKDPKQVAKQDLAVPKFPAVVEAYPELALTIDESKRAAKLSVFAVGDSVIEMCRSDFSDMMGNMNIDAAVSRQVPAGIDILRELKKTNSLPQFVFFELGTNGVINSEMLDELATEFSKHEIYIPTIVTDQDYEANVNEIIKAACEKHKNLHLIDWYSFAKNKSDIFYSDGTHPNLQGTPIYVQLVTKMMMRDK